MRAALGAHFWLSFAAEYRYRTIYEDIDMPLDWPVDVNYHEAKAFCTWKGAGAPVLRFRRRVTCTEYRLLTEAEHNILRDPAPTTDPVRATALPRHP